MTEATTYRPATSDDETNILAVLEEVAPEISVRLDGEERQNKIKTEIRQCHQTKKSWVAVDKDGKVLHEQEALTSNGRSRGIQALP